MTLVPVDTTNALAVSDYLDKAKQWLATAVEMTGPHEIASAKAEIATAAEATKQLGLSKDIQLDAQEMVRRAEYALGRAIRKGQAEGTILRQGEKLTAGGGAVSGTFPTKNSGKTRSSEFGTLAELHGSGETPGILTIADAAEPDAFHVALAEAKSEGNASRTNVGRKIAGGAGPTTRDQRADLIEELAAQGYSSRQMPIKVGVTEETVRQIARDFNIEIPADKSVGRTRRINSTHVVENTATALEGLVMGLELIDYQDVDPAVASQWADSLSESMRALNRFVRQIKEQTQ